VKLLRRGFIRLAALAALSAVAAACGIKTKQVGLTETDTPRTISVSPEAPTPITLQNENRPATKPTWNVRFFRPFKALDHRAWRLNIEGMVAEPKKLSLDEIVCVPSVEQESRMVCVEGWSCKAKWTGFTYQTLADLVKPSPEATWLYIHCADGYYEYLPIADLLKPRVLFVFRMDGELLPDLFGAPLRLIVPFKWGYKGPKTITLLRFQDKGGNGYWPTVGLYSSEGTVQPGIDHPVDLGGRREMQGGEVTQY
jgi:DMSO/TMAO reductase YedYZ molybdopterin-dependent catalytic subunit